MPKNSRMLIRLLDTALTVVPPVDPAELVGFARLLLLSGSSSSAPSSVASPPRPRLGVPSFVSLIQDLRVNLPCEKGRGPACPSDPPGGGLREPREAPGREGGFRNIRGLNNGS